MGGGGAEPDPPWTERRQKSLVWITPRSNVRSMRSATNTTAPILKGKQRTGKKNFSFLSCIMSFLGILSSKLMVCIRFIQSFMLLVSIFFVVSIFCNSILKLRLSPSTRLPADKQCSVHETGEDSNLQTCQKHRIITWDQGISSAGMIV